MPNVPSLTALCAQVLSNSNVTYTDPNDAQNQYVYALINAHQTVAAHQEAFVDLHTDVTTFLEDLNDHPENLDSNPDPYLEGAVSLGHRIAQMLTTMSPMSEWLGAVADDPLYASTYKSYRQMYDWLSVTQETLASIISAINDVALTPN